MSIVLSPIEADALDHIEEGFTREFIRALARHAPLEFMRFVERGKYVEVLRDGAFRTPIIPDGATALEEWPGVRNYVLALRRAQGRASHS